MVAHPDKGGSESKMAAVNEAYEVLSNPGVFLYRLDVCFNDCHICRTSPALR